MTFEYTPQSNTLDFTLASLDDPARLVPAYHIWTKSRIPWFDTRDEAPRHLDSGPDTWT